MNKEGFTLVELVITFALASVLIILLLNVVLLIRNIYSQNNIKSNLILEQSNLSHIINKKFSSGNLETYEFCNDSDFCYIFKFIDGTTSKLNISENTIVFDIYSYNLIEGSNFGELKVETISLDLLNTIGYNSMLVINIPIIHKLYPNSNFGIKVVYQYNSNRSTL